MKTFKIIYITLLIFILSIVLGCVCLYYYNESINKTVGLTTYDFYHEEIPASFDGYKIFMVSDLHNAPFSGEINEHIRNTKPDIIVFTGDMVQLPNDDLTEFLKIVKEFRHDIPCYFVSGNHEKALNYPKVRTLLEGVGAVVLDNETVTINKNGEEIKLIGLLDYYFSRNMTRTLKKAIKDDSGFNILLSHQPDFMDEYSSYDIELVLSGHEHGGQFRIPFIGGVYSPHQGIFPKLSEGMHEENGTTIVISRGLGNSTFPLRLFNRPELVVIDLQKN